MIKILIFLTTFKICYKSQTIYLTSSVCVYYFHGIDLEMAQFVHSNKNSLSPKLKPANPLHSHVYSDAHYSVNALNLSRHPDSHTYRGKGHLAFFKYMLHMHAKFLPVVSLGTDFVSQCGARDVGSFLLTFCVYFGALCQLLVQKFLTCSLQKILKP